MGNKTKGTNLDEGYTGVLYTAITISCVWNYFQKMYLKEDTVEIISMF